MNIESVKKSTNGYLVNGSIFVPNNPNNSQYSDILKWIDQGGIFEPEFSLDEIKTKKITEIKSIRDSKNIEPITDIQAATLNEDGSPTGQSSYFIFYTSRHPTNPAADPTSILTSAVVLNSTVPYSTSSPSGEKIIAALTPEIARAISTNMMLRNNGSYKLSDAIEAAVKAASSIEEVEAITWNEKYLKE